MDKVKCWELFRCAEKKCPAYKSKNLKCWLFSDTHCRNEIKGKFLEKMEMCLDCKVFKKNMDPASMRKTLGEINTQLKGYRQMVGDRDGELNHMNVELSVGLSETFEALKKIAKGDPAVRIPETSEIELIGRLKHLVNITAENIGEIVDQSHEFAMGLAEHFDVLQRVSRGELDARADGESTVELLISLNKVTNQMIESISREINERKLTENSLRKLEALESSILSAIPHAVIGSLNRKIIFANDAVEKVFGWKPEELVGKNTRIFYRTDEEYEEIDSHFYPVLERQRNFSEDFSCRHRDGRDIYCAVSAALIGDQFEEKAVVMIYEDITERRKIEETLRESEKKYLDLYQNAPDGYHSLGADGTLFEVNDTWVRMLGYERDEVVGRMKLSDLLADEDIKTFTETFSDLKKKGMIENVDYSVKKHDGTRLPVLINATAVYSDKGEFLTTRSIVRDNSERKTYQKKLQHAAEEWRATFDNMPYGVILLDADLNIIRANNYISELYRIPINNITGRNCCELDYGNNSPKEFCAMIKAKNISVPQTFEYLDNNLNKHFMLHETPVFEEGVINAYVLSFIDITDSKNKEIKLTESKDAFFNMLKELDVSYKELKGLYESLIRSFVRAIDAKSPWTKGHSERVTYYVISIAKEMGVNEQDIEKLRIAALLHDIGKLGTYDVILDKPGKLNEEEFALIRMHPVRGEEILKPIKQFKELLPIIRHHHERVDGKGYPDGLKADQIPFLSKMITIADSFDSMTSDRPYRPAPPREYALAELKRCSGTQFEPRAVDAFLSFLEKTENSKDRENPEVIWGSA
jgi:PAS domain S-box-containing protein/putative nucleotidyltransferase with HDIG domain